ncbi:hypothetical protein FRC00_013525, partial [Tulasnella sp. 408]
MPSCVIYGKDDLQREALPRSLYPILPPPTFDHPRTRPINISRSSSVTNASSATVVTENQDYEATSE